MDEVLPADDAQAWYFGLCAIALHEVAVMVDFGFVRPQPQVLIDDDIAEVVIGECERRGFSFTDEEVNDKCWDFIQQWESVSGR